MYTVVIELKIKVHENSAPYYDSLSFLNNARRTVDFFFMVKTCLNGPCKAGRGEERAY